MKSCPTCSRTFEDTFTFCLADGSLLDAPVDPHATLIIPKTRQTEPPPTELVKREETKQEIPPTIASPQPEQKPRELLSTLAAPAPAFEAPHITASLIQPQRKPKRWLTIVGVIAALIILATFAAFHFSKTGEPRIAFVWLQAGSNQTTRFKPDDAKSFTVVVQPEPKGELLTIRWHVFSREYEATQTGDVFPSMADTLIGSRASFPLNEISRLGKYRLEVKLTSGVRQLDTKTVEFDVTAAGGEASPTITPNSNKTSNTATPSQSPSLTPVVILEGTSWEFMRDRRYKEILEFKPDGKITRRFETDVRNGTWTKQGNKVVINIAGNGLYYRFVIEGTIQGEGMSGEYNFGGDGNQSFTAHMVK